MNDKLSTLLIGVKRIRENLLGIQRLIALEDSVQEKPLVLETITQREEKKVEGKGKDQ